MPAQPAELSARRAARLLGCHVQTVYNWCKAGRLETARIDVTGHYWIQRDEIEALMREADQAAKARVAAYRARKQG